MSSPNAQGLKRSRGAKAAAKAAEQSSSREDLTSTTTLLRRLEGAIIWIIAAYSVATDATAEKQLNAIYRQLQNLIGCERVKLASAEKASSKRRVTGRSKPRSVEA
jgi:hypothetical protein